MTKHQKTLTILAVLGVMVLLAFPTSAVFAQNGEPPKAANQAGKQQKDLGDIFEDLCEKYEDMDDGLKNADKIVTKLERWIERRSAEGKDTAEIETILETFQTNLEAIQTAYDDVGTLIETHAGFDANGEVTDDSTAIATLRSIAEGMLDIHQLTEDARSQLQWDIMTFRYLNQED